MNANEYLRGYLKAIDLEENVKSEHLIANVTSEDFEEKNETIRKLIIHLDDARKVVCNQDRTATLTRAFGKNTDLWVGQKIFVSTGQTTYSGKPVACITFEAILAPRIQAQPIQRRGKMTVVSGKKAPPAAQPPIDDEIPF
jgi:hypothetical protein